MRYKFFLIGLLVAVMAAGCAKEGMPTGGPKDETPPKVLGAEPKTGSTNWTAKEFMILFDEYVTVKDADKNILVSPPMNTKPEYTTKGHAVVVKLKDSLRANTTYLFQFKEGIVDYNEGNPLASYEYVFSTGSSIDSMTIRGKVLDALTHQTYKSEGVITVVAYSVDQMAHFDSIQNLYLDSLLKADTTGTLAEKIDKTHLGDSIVAKEKPLYMTRCDQEGKFEMNHLREGHYRVLAFDDGDNNLLLKAGEAVAFLDTLVLAEHMPPPPDTAKTDSTQMDSTMADSVAALADTLTQNSQLSTKDSKDSLSHSLVDSLTSSSDSLTSTTAQPISNTILNISLYKEEVQRLAKVEFKGKGQITLATVLPLTEHYTLRPLDTTDKRVLYIKSNAKRDTLNIWTEDKNCDSIRLLFDDKGIHDTLKLVYRAPKNVASSGKLPSKGLSKGNSLMSNMVSAKHPYYDTLWIGFERPVRSIAYGAPDSLVTIFDQVDSTTTYCGVKWIDSCLPTGYHRAMIDFKGKPGGKYKFKVPAMSFSDIYGAMHHDSLTFTTEFTKVEEYGNIIVSVQSSMFNLQCDSVQVEGDSVSVETTDSLSIPSSPDSTQNSELKNQNPRFSNPPILIQLINEKGEVQRQKTIRNSEKLSFAHLKGGKYALRAIVDRDSNGTWTPGDYWKQRQPEEAFYFEKVLELRENWDMEETWTIKPSNNPMPFGGGGNEKGSPKAKGGNTKGR